MKIFLITFMSSTPERQNDLIENIKRYNTWARITSTTWCIKADITDAGELRDRLSNNMNDSERLFVVDITRSNWGSFCLPRKVTNWLKEN